MPAVQRRSSLVAVALTVTELGGVAHTLLGGRESTLSAGSTVESLVLGQLER
jgi:hypothetical protein